MAQIFMIQKKTFTSATLVVTAKSEVEVASQGQVVSGSWNSTGYREVRSDAREH
jgi:hypothetical protein